MKENKNVWQAVKFTLFSASAGVIQIGSFALLEIFIEDYWIPYLISLVLSILWNFTLNRRYTFKSAANVPVAMAKVFGFYLVFTPLSTYLGNLAEDRGMHDFLILIVTMLANFVLEFLFCKFVVYRGKEDTLESTKTGEV
jgi:putative flippase GtrA